VTALLGWDDRWEAELRAVDPAGALAAVRVVAEHRGAYHASDGAATAAAELTGRAFHAADDKRALPTVGDWIAVERWPDAIAGKGAAVIRHVLPRRTFLVRKAAGDASVPQPLAANVDVGIVMTSANADLSPARLDRYVDLLRGANISPVLVLSKVDLVADPEPALAAMRAVAEVPVLSASVVRGTGLDALRALAGPGRTAILLGSSGVGKSTLLNVLADAEQATASIRADDRGRHTTTRRELFATPTGAWIDTPGLRELAQWLDRDDAPVFDDIAALAASCRFRDCRHRDEPGCAVRDVIDPARLASYHKLAAERASASARQASARRLAESRKAKAKKPSPPDE
jgi:ribosome biogenesis GTPase